MVEPPETKNGGRGDEDMDASLATYGGRAIHFAYDYIEWLEARVSLTLWDTPEEWAAIRDAWRTAFEALLPTTDDVRGILR